jgi:hypothetical protein
MLARYYPIHYFMRTAILLLIMVIGIRLQASPGIPPIAALGGIRVGFDTVQTLDRLLGPARVSTGGHPRGIHTWRSQQSGYGLQADGFYYNDQGGRVIDSLSVFIPSSEEAQLLPMADLPRKELLFMGVVSLGMGQKEVMKLLQGKLPKPKRDGATLVWKVDGDFRFNSVNHYRFKNWTAKLQFDRNQLSEINIDAS